MHIIYYDVGGAHSVAVASALHLHKLPIDHKPNKDDILSLPTFDKVKTEDIGHLIYQGDDEFGNQVYTLGCKYYRDIVLATLEDTYNLVGNRKNLLLIDTKPTINTIMKIGGYTSRVLGLMTIGRPIVVRGVLKAYPQLVNLVTGVKKKLNRIN